MTQQDRRTLEERRPRGNQVAHAVGALRHTIWQEGVGVKFVGNMLKSCHSEPDS